MALFPFMIVGQSAEGSKPYSLPTTVAPVAPLAELRGATLLSRSGYAVPGGMRTGRVFRYSVRQDFAGFVRKLGAPRAVKDGWKATSRTPYRVIFENDRPLGEVLHRACVVINARIVAAPREPFGIRVIPASKALGWTWVSYNEHIRLRR